MSQAGQRASASARRHGLPCSQSPATLLLIAGLLASAAVLLYETRNITFLLDDWEFLLGRPGSPPTRCSRRTTSTSI